MLYVRDGGPVLAVYASKVPDPSSNLVSEIVRAY